MPKEKLPVFLLFLCREISIKACFEKRIKVGLYANVQICKYANRKIFRNE